jgi:malonyl CoA-acyl carrier protein transacylase
LDAYSQLDPIEALKLIRRLAIVASGSQELGYLKTTLRDVLVIIDRASPPRDKSGALLEPITDILAETARCHAEAIQILKAVEAGAELAAGMTREQAVRILAESIAFYEQMLRR